MNARLKSIWKTRELSTLFVLALEVAFFAWYLWPEGGRSHPFFNLGNFVLILKYSSLYGIAAIGAAMVIISGGVDLAPGAVMALAGVVTGDLVVIQGYPLSVAVTAGGGGRGRWGAPRAAGGGGGGGRPVPPPPG